MKRLDVCAFALLTGLAGPSFAQTTVTTTDGVTTEVATPAEQTLIRRMTLAELGYQDGLSFSRLSGQADLFFPVPETPAVQRAKLVLNIDSGGTVKSERFLQVVIGGRVAAAFDLTQQRPTAQLEVPVDMSRATGGFLTVTLLYSGGISDQICVDERSSGDFVEISEQSQLVLAIDPAQLDTAEAVLGIQPPDTRIALPDGPLTPAHVTAAIRAAALYGAESGRVSFGGAPAETGSEWSQAQIELSEAAADSRFAVSLGAGSIAGWPSIAISGTDPQQAFDVLSPDWRGVTGLATLATNGVSGGGGGENQLSFEGLGFDLRPIYAAGTATFDFTFDIADLPKGTRPGSVSLLATAARGSVGSNQGEVSVVAFLNDTIIGSGSLPDGDPKWFDFDIPSGLEGRDNLLRVQILRQPRGGECIYASQSYPSQILPGSTINLVDRPGPPEDFYVLRQDMQDGIDLLIDPALMTGASDELLELVSPALASLVPPQAELTSVTSVSDADATQPFIVVSDLPPAGSDPRLRLDAGIVELRNSEGEVVFTGSDLDTFAMAQIVTVGTRSGLWLRPGSGPTPVPSERRPLIVDRGDVALLDGYGVALATATSRTNLVRIEYPERRDIVKIIEQYRPWIAGGLWILITLVVLRILRSLYKSRQRSGEAE